MTKNKNIAVIGGGVLGTSAAFYLNQIEDASVTLFDKDFGQATKATGGVISPWLSRRRNKVWYRLVKNAAAFYPGFIEDIGEDPENSRIYKRTGTLMFKEKRHHLDELLEIGKERRKDAPEIGDLKILTPDEIREIFPIYNRDHACVYIEGGARCDGKLLIEYMHKKLDAIGVTLRNEEVTVLEKGKEDYQVITQNQIETYDAVVVTAGAWSASLLEPLGYEVDSLTQKGQIAEMIIKEKDTNNFPVIMPAGGKNVIPFEDGRFLIGATHEKEEGYDTEIVPELVQPMIDDAASQLSDQFYDPEELTYRVGIRSYTSDFSPYFGEVEGSPNLFVANGFGATGLNAGPLVGRILANMIAGVEGDTNDLVLKEYSPNPYVKLK